MEAELDDRGYIAVGFHGTLVASGQAWDLDASEAEPITRMVARVKQHLEEGIPVRILEPRLSMGAAEASHLTKELEAWCEQHLGTKLPVVAAADASAMLVIDTRVNQVFDGRGITVDEVLAVLLQCLDGVSWDTVPKLESFRPEGAGPTIRFTELLTGVFDRI